MNDPGLETVREVLDRYAASRANRRTAGTYASRLRPIAQRLGDTPAGTLTLPRWAALERELVDELGDAPTHKALTLARAALRDAGHLLEPDDVIKLVAAARQFHVATGSLQALVDDGRVRSLERRRYGRGTSITFNVGQLKEDLARLPRCLAASCDRPGTGRTGYCGDHFSEGGRGAAQRLEAATLRPTERDWYTITEAAREAPCAPDTLRKAISDGRLPAERVGRHHRVPRVELHEWAETLPGARQTGRRKQSRAQLAARRDRIGRMRADGLKVGTMARSEGVSKPTIYNDLAELNIEREGQGRQSRRLAAGDRERRKDQAAKLYVAGFSERQIADQLDSSPAQIRRDLDDRNVPRRPAGRAAKYPEPSERPCDHCGAPFIPEHPSHDAGQPRRFCRAKCEQDWRRDRREEALERRGLCDTRAAAAALELGVHRIHDLIAAGLLRSELVEYRGMIRPAHGLREDELARFERTWARGGDGRRRTPLDEEVVLAQAERDGRLAQMVEDGQSREDARETIRRRVARRRSKLARRRSGRKPASKLHQRWLERYRYHLAELEAMHAAGELDVAPTHRSVCAAVGEEDWSLHPWDWPRIRYPASPAWPDSLDRRGRPAVEDRVRKALKPLLIAGNQ